MTIKKAVALKYMPDLPAPFVIAKGKGELARRIEEIARANGIEIVGDGELTERLCAIELGDYIPEDLYQIIAEVLIFALRLGS